MATVVVPLSSPEQIVSTIAASIAGLKKKGSDEYSSRCEDLTAALLHLSDHLHQLRQDDGQQGDETRRIRLLIRARISASITYYVVDMLTNYDPQLCCSCWGDADHVADGLDRQLIETRTLVEAIASYIKATAGSEHSQEGDRLPAPESVLSGVSCLTFTTPRSVDSKIQSGEEIRFPVVDASERLVYTVKTWISNPASWFNTARRLAASIEIEEGGHGMRELDIRLPEQKDPNSAPRERTAFLYSSGTLQAEVKSVLPDNARMTCWGSPMDGAGTLLQRDHMVSSTGRNSQRHYKPQDYSVELRLTAKVFELGLEGGPVGTFRLKGRKKEYKASCVCRVEQTGEVLAIYLHRRREHLGVVQFIGVGMHPELRDLIMGGLVAMGLHSQL